MAELYGKTKDTCGEDLKSGQQIIQLFKTGTSTYALVVSGYNEDDVRSASVIVEKYEDSAMTGTAVIR